MKNDIGLEAVPEIKLQWLTKQRGGNLSARHGSDVAPTFAHWKLLYLLVGYLFS